MLISKYSNSPYNTFKEFVWDPTEPVATRPLIFRYAPNNLNLFYAFDGNKNVSDVFYRMTSNGIGAHYDYAPFGATSRTHSDSSASFDIVSLNPFRFSSEYYDSELDLVYYNYRHYSPSLGRFLSRDPIEEQGGWNLYAFVGNNSSITDYLGEAQHGCNNVTHTEFQNLSDEEVNRRYEELSRKKQRTRADNEMLRKLKAEQKGRLLRHSRMKLLGSRCKGGFATPQAMAVQIICTLVAMYMESELEKAIEDDGGSEDLLALSANCSRGIDGLWRCSCPSGTTAYGAGDLSCKTFTNRPLIMCIKHNADIPINWLIGLVESNNLQSIKNENCCKAQETTCGTY